MAFEICRQLVMRHRAALPISETSRCTRVAERVPLPRMTPNRRSASSRLTWLCWRAFN